MIHRYVALALSLVCTSTGCGADSDDTPDASGEQTDTNGNADSGRGVSSGFGQDSGAPSDGHFHAPKVAPLVRDATPGALKPMAALRPLRALQNMLAFLSPVSIARAEPPMANVDDSIRALFQDMYVKISGGQAQGKINAALQDLDDRMAQVDMSPSTSGCLNAPAQAHRVDLHDVSPTLDLTLLLQCRVDGLMAFGREASLITLPPAFGDFDSGTADEDAGAAATTGRIARGGDSYSLWLYLPHTGTDGFGYFANVRHVGTESESVDFTYMESSTAEFQRTAAYRVRATPATKHFEFVYGSTNGDGAAGDNLRCGFRMISDGTHIFADGVDHQPGQPCADAAPFTRCLLAGDLTEDAAAPACKRLQQQLTLQAPTAEQLASAGPAIAAALPITNTEDVTTTF